MPDTPKMELSRADVLELRTMAMKVQTDLARYGDRWARRQPRARYPLPDQDARLDALVRVFVDLVLEERPAAPTEDRAATAAS